MSSGLDCTFYTSFYDDVASLKDPLAINEHYHNVGKKEGRVANENELNDLVAQLLHFDSNIYSTTNISSNLPKTLKENFSNFSTNKDWVNHYYGPNGNLYSINRFRLINNNDLKYLTNLWDDMYNKIFETVGFNFLFYKTFYSIPSNITNLRDLELNWVKNGMFIGQYPNLKSLTENKNVIDIVKLMLSEKFNLDMNFIANYKNNMVEYMKKKSLPILDIKDESTFLLYLFLNTGYNLCLYFNKTDMDKICENRIKLYNESVESVKKGTYKNLLTKNEKTYDYDSISLMKSAPKKDVVPLLLNNFSDIISLKNIIKLSNSTVVECFKRLYNKDNLTDVIITMITNELKNCVDPVINSMEVKILVTSVVYNVFINDKTTSILYKDMVKAKSIEIINKIFEMYGVEAGSVDVVEQDVIFLIENKKIIKLVYFSNLIIKGIVEAFLLVL